MNMTLYMDENFVYVNPTFGLVCNTKKKFINLQKHCSYALRHSKYLDYRKPLRAFSHANDDASFALALQIFRLDPLLNVRGVRSPVALVCIVLPNIAHLII